MYSFVATITESTTITFPQDFYTKNYHSTELPLDWLSYYDALSRVSRDPTELYGSKNFSVPYLILPDKTKTESHYYYATKDFNGDKLIPSKD